MSVGELWTTVYVIRDQMLAYGGTLYLIVVVAIVWTRRGIRLKRSCGLANRDEPILADDFK